MYRPVPGGDNRLIHELPGNRGWLIPDFPTGVDEMWTGGLCNDAATSMARLDGVDFDGR
jgi:hypothetical protein